MSKIAILDRDGTIIEDKEYVHHEEDLTFLPQSIAGLHHLQKQGYKLLIATNQSGIGRGYFTQAQYDHFTDVFLNQLSDQRIQIEAILHCPHLPTDSCTCRKPNPAQIEKYLQEHHLCREDSICIGDKTSDIKLGENLNLTTILISTGKAGQDKEYATLPHYTSPNLLDAATWVERKNKVRTIDQMYSITQQYKQERKTIVFTNGCFDIIHPGHIKLLRQAKSYGNILILGLNTDESVSKLKGPTRPINSLESRIEVLAAMQDVDYIVPFEEETPYNLIQQIIPNVLVKGSDYTTDTVIGSGIITSNGGTVKLVDLKVGTSTTNIIQKMRSP